MNKLVVLSGIDGSGKSSIAKELSKKLNAFHTFEPLGESLAKKQNREPYIQEKMCQNLRTYCLDGSYDKYVPSVAREHMMIANRSISSTLVKEHLNNSTVVCDRCFIDGMVFAKVASKMEYEAWLQMGASAVTNKPNVIIFCDVKERKVEQDLVHSNDIYDNASEEFHSKIRDEFNYLLRDKNIKQVCPTLVADDVIIIHFYVDMTKTAQDNTEILMSVLEEQWKVSY